MSEASRPRRTVAHDAFTECWYVPGETAILDFIYPDDGLTLHFKESADVITRRYPTAQRRTIEDAWKLADAAGSARYRQGIQEIDAESFDDAVNVLPPVGWTTRRGVESFRMPEMLWGPLTDIYARIGSRTFKLSDDIRLSADVIADRVHAFLLLHPDVPAAPERATAEATTAPQPSTLMPGGDA